MYRIGQSNDIHSLNEIDSNIYLGGFRIISKFEIVSHSDGDIILHALAEAIYGALCLGDLGDHFSDEDEKNKNLSSKLILNHALNKLNFFKYEIINVDMTIICEKIYINDHKNQIKDSVKNLINCKNVNIKATRWEESKNIIQCNCIVLLKKIL